MKNILLVLGLALTVVFSASCSRSFLGGAAVGVGGAGAAYEYQNKKALDELEDDFKAGRVDRDEYLRRKKEIEEKSLVY